MVSNQTFKIDVDIALDWTIKSGCRFNFFNAGKVEEGMKIAVIE